ncbi:MAG: S53 family peptidase [Tepidisphaeraceae bacterium]
MPWPFPLFEPLEPRRLLSVSYTPAQIQAAYGFNQITFDNGTVPGNGAGQTIALIEVDNDATINTDLSNFDSAFNLPNPGSSWSFTVVGQKGGAPPSTPASLDESAETALDVEWAHAIAPAANILVVEANSSFDSDLFPAIYYARAVPGVSVISMSYSRAELPGDIDTNGNYTTPAQHTGITYVAASGDSGSVSYPSSSPNVVGVGGTSLTLAPNNTYASETAWSGSGGGYSSVESEPAYQYAVQSTGQRSTPDVAYDADPNTGLDFYFQGSSQLYRVGGTSAGAPQWAALFAIADQGRALNGLDTLDSSTDTLPMLYALYDTSLYNSAFHDITTGGNSSYSATTGYDPVTGLGSPQANVLVQYLAGNITIPEPASITIALAAIPLLLRPARTAARLKAPLADAQ